MRGGSLFETFMGMVGGRFATHVVYRCLSDQKLEPGSQFGFHCLLRQELFFLLINHIIETFWLVTLLEKNVVMYVGINLTQVPEVLIFYVLFFHAPPED